MADEQTAVLDKPEASDKIAERLYSDELYTAPRHTPETAPAEKVEVPEVKQEEAQKAEVEAPKETAAEETKLPDFDINKFIKEEYGFDSKEVAKEQIERWRKAEAEPKEKEPTKPKFDNEESERLYNAIVGGKKTEAFEILKKQAELEKAAELPPLEQIKLDLQYKNPKFTKEDIEDVVEERYSYPKKPEDYEEDYDEKIRAYEKEVAKIDRRIKRDGLEAVENLQKHKSDLVLPDINSQAAAEFQKFQQQQKELEAEENKARESYKAALDKDYSSFKGYTTGYKDKEVEVPIEYKPTEQELKQLKDKFANDFDADEYFANRWIKTENNKVVGFNVPLQMEDIHLLENKQKIFDKIASDAAARAVAAYLANEHNINFNSSNDKVPDTKGQSFEERIASKLFG